MMGLDTVRGRSWLPRAPPRAVVGIRCRTRFRDARRHVLDLPIDAAQLGLHLRQIAPGRGPDLDLRAGVRDCALEHGAAVPEIGNLALHRPDRRGGGDDFNRGRGAHERELHRDAPGVARRHQHQVVFLIVGTAKHLRRPTALDRAATFVLPLAAAAHHPRGIEQAKRLEGQELSHVVQRLPCRRRHIVGGGASLDVAEDENDAEALRHCSRLSARRGCLPARDRRLGGGARLWRFGLLRQHGRLR